MVASNLLKKSHTPGKLPGILNYIGHQCFKQCHSSEGLVKIKKNFKQKVMFVLKIPNDDALEV